MALRNPPTFLQASQHPAENTRLALAGSMGATIGAFSPAVANATLVGDPAHGRLLPTDLNVTQNGTPNMSVNVAAGAAWIRGSESATQGAYHVVSDAVVNLPIATADATNPRLDLVVVRVKDADYSGSDNEVVFEVVTGTPAGTPVAPAVPDNGLALALISVGAAASSIVTANITNYLGTPVGYRLGRRLFFTSNGTFTKADYPWLKAVQVICVGGGGSGGHANAQAGSGGGGGAFAMRIVNAALVPSSVTITRGAGGAAVGNALGNNGASSSFGSLVVAAGGSGGNVNSGGRGGSSGTGDLVLRGSGGSAGSRGGTLDSGRYICGAGGAAGGGYGGGGSGEIRDVHTGHAGELYGGGGGGGVGTSQTSGAGANGIVIVELLA